MRPRTLSILLVLACASDAGTTQEPILGGACEGCELVFAGMPERLTSHSRLAPASEPGEPMRITGTVRTRVGLPAAGVIVYAYQTDATGIYPAGPTRHGRLRGWVRTDTAGTYAFETIRPGAYPEGDLPEHIHMHVIEQGKGTYYVEDIVFDDDPRMTNSRRRDYANGRGGSGLTHPVQDDTGTWLVRRDITLGLGVADYPR